MKSRAKRILVNCSRQSGKSTTCAVLALHESLYRSPSVGLSIAPAQRQSKELMEKFNEFRSAVELSSKPLDEDTKLSVKFSNGNRFIALPGSEKTIRGISAVTLLIEDEAARVEDALKNSVSPMLAVSGGRYIELSTPWGKRGHFYEAWNSGIGWEKYTITAEQCPRITPEFLQAELDSGMPRQFWLQEYFCEFLDMDDQLFSSEMVEAAVDPSITALEF